MKSTECSLDLNKGSVLSITIMTKVGLNEITFDKISS